MLDEIKNYWKLLKRDYEAKYQEDFLDDYDRSKEYLEKMEAYLLEKQELFPWDLDLLSTLASVKFELREDEDICLGLFKDFLEKFADFLDPVQRARIYTNMAFYDYGEGRLDYLERAYALKSPYLETYKGLGLYYFSQYQFDGLEKNLSISKKYFRQATEVAPGYEPSLDYGICLYELGAYERARDIFLGLYKKYPNRIRVLICLAYCEAYLENKNQAKAYLDKVDPGQDQNYSLSSDEIGDYEIFNLYYVLGEDSKFLSSWNEERLAEYYIADWDHYFYALWRQNKRDLFAKLEEKTRAYFEKALEEVELDEDYDSPEEKEEILAGLKGEKRDFEEMICQIKLGGPRPGLKLSLEPESSCFLVDCVRHKF